VTLAKDCDRYVKEVSKFKEKKWDVIAAQHVEVYELMLNAKKPLVLQDSNSKIASDTN
jgi:hypothetical protein